LSHAHTATIHDNLSRHLEIVTIAVNNVVDLKKQHFFGHCSSFLLCTPFSDPDNNTVQTTVGKGMANKVKATFIEILGLESGLLGDAAKRGRVKDSILGSTFQQLRQVEWQASFIIVSHASV
jgi:hypothetical protein